jgi:Ring finger domain
VTFPSAILCFALFAKHTRRASLPFNFNDWTNHHHQQHTQEQLRTARLQRKACIDSALVVKHVIPGPTSATSEEKDSKREDSAESDENVGGYTNKSGSSTTTAGDESSSQTIRRLKSNLVLSTIDDTSETASSNTRESAWGEEPWICAICLAPYVVGDEICWSRNPECTHVFHHECIEHWLYKHDDCPVCRAVYITTSYENDSSNPAVSNRAQHYGARTTSTHQGVVREGNDDQVLIDQGYGVEEPWDVETPYTPRLGGADAESNVNTISTARAANS